MGVMDNGVAMEIGVELVNSAVCIHVVRGIAYCVSGCRTIPRVTMTIFSHFCKIIRCDHRTAKTRDPAWIIITISDIQIFQLP